MFALSYTLPFETPAQKNEVRFARGHTFKSARFSEWKRAALLSVRGQGVPFRPFEAANISVTFIHADLRRRDGDNQLASIQDLLVAAGVIADDCWTRIGTPEVRHTVGNTPECRIAVQECEPTDWAEIMKRFKGKK